MCYVVFWAACTRWLDFWCPGTNLVYLVCFEYVSTFFSIKLSCTVNLNYNTEMRLTLVGEVVCLFLRLLCDVCNQSDKPDLYLERLKCMKRIIQRRRNELILEQKYQSGWCIRGDFNFFPLLDSFITTQSASTLFYWFLFPLRQIEVMYFLLLGD